MKVSAKEQYGLRAIAELAARYGEGPTSLNDVAQAQGISLAYLEQVIRELRDAGLVFSTRGARGGYELARAPGAITVAEVLRALGGDILPVQCVRRANGVGAGTSPGGGCAGQPDACRFMTERNDK